MKRLRGAILLIVFSLLGAACFLPVLTLQVFRGDSGHPLLALRLLPGEKWEIRYLHSWYRVPQHEIYRIGTQGEMILEEMNFGSYPAALYYEENPRQGFIQEGGWWKIRNIHQPLPSFRFKVGYTTNCRLVIGGKSIPFSSLAPPGASLIFKVQKIPCGEYLLFHLLKKEPS